MKRLHQGKANKFGWKTNNMHDRRLSSDMMKNQQTDKGIGILAVVVIILIVVIRSIM